MANDFTGDPNCICLMNFDIADEDNPSTGWWYDSSGNAQNFSGNQAVEPNTVDYQQGDASCAFVCDGVYQVGDYLSRADADLSADWPLKSTFAGTVKFSYCAWFRPGLLPTATANDTQRSLLGKYNFSSGERCIGLSEVWDGTKAILRFAKGWNSGASSELTSHTRALVSGQWYHIGLTYDDTDHGMVMRLWDETAGTVYEVTDTHSNSMEPDASNEALMIGNQQITAAQYYEFDGLMDEVVFFDDELTSDEIDEIRLGTYGASTASPQMIRVGPF